MTTGLSTNHALFSQTHQLAHIKAQTGNGAPGNHDDDDEEEEDEYDDDCESLSDGERDSLLLWDKHSNIVYNTYAEQVKASVSCGFNDVLANYFLTHSAPIVRLCNNVWLL